MPHIAAERKNYETYKNIRIRFHFDPVFIYGGSACLCGNIPEDQLGWRSYNAEDGTKYVVITECICEDPVWEFPAEIDGKPVLKIEQLHPDDASFSNTTTKEIIIPEGVEEIHYAFVSYFALEKVTLPQSLKKIGWSCFRGCSALKEINLPEGLEVIDYDVFSYCKALEAVKIPDSVTELGKQAFSTVRR